MKTLKVGVADGAAKKIQDKKKTVGSQQSSTGSGSGMGTGFVMFVVVALAIAGYFFLGKAS